MLGYTGQQWVISAWKSSRIHIPVPLFWFFKVYLLLPDFWGYFGWLVFEKKLLFGCQIKFYFNPHKLFIFKYSSTWFYDFTESDFKHLICYLHVEKINASINMRMLKWINSIFVWILCTQLGKEHNHCLCTCPSVL